MKFEFQHEFVTTREECDVSKCLESGQVFRWNPLSESAFQLWLGDEQYRIVQEKSRILVESNVPPANFVRLFRLEESLEEKHAQILGCDTRVSEIVAQCSGLRILNQPNLLEVILAFMCSVNNNISRIQNMVKHLVDEYGDRESGRFPHQSELANCTEQALRTAKFGYRATTIHGFLSMLNAENNAGVLRKLQSLSYPESAQFLIQTKGVGRKMADCICLFGLNQTEAFPIDTHVWQAYHRIFQPSARIPNLTERRYMDLSQQMRETFGQNAGWVQQYLFYSNLKRRAS